MKLDDHYDLLHSTILKYQHPVSGLFPPSPGIRDAWVRDNVYTVCAVWAMSLAYKKTGANPARAYELEKRVVKTMRALLVSMMRQSHKVSRFKHTQNPADALHAKFDLATGNTCVTDDGWGHLQIDATSLYLLMLAQMTVTGVHIIFNLNEVAFVQNLVFYIQVAYRTPDYGIWERGDKANRGETELNASSIGMAKAALESIAGINLFGAAGGPASTIHVLPDEIRRNQIMLSSLLPRGSKSKEIDASLLTVAGFPAFAVEDELLVTHTQQRVEKKLSGRYGYCRFLRDGYMTVLEDRARLHYEPAELRVFEGIECQWPVFYIFRLLDRLFHHDDDPSAPEVLAIDAALQAVLVHDNPVSPTVPELYYVPHDAVAAEKEHPHSQTRVCGAIHNMLWAQGLYVMSRLLVDRLVAPGELDPLNRRRQLCAPRFDPVVQVVLLAQDTSAESHLRELELPFETRDTAAPLIIGRARHLMTLYNYLGANAQLGLTGRPSETIGSLATSKLYVVRGVQHAFIPTFLDDRSFYLSLDIDLMLDNIKSHLSFMRSHWREIGRPTLTIPITTESLLHGSRALRLLLLQLQSGSCNGVRVQMGRYHDMTNTSCTEYLAFLDDPSLVLPTISTTAPLPSSDSQPHSQPTHNNNPTPPTEPIFSADPTSAVSNTPDSESCRLEFDPHHTELVADQLDKHIQSAIVKISVSSSSDDDNNSNSNSNTDNEEPLTTTAAAAAALLPPSPQPRGLITSSSTNYNLHLRLANSSSASFTHDSHHGVVLASRVAERARGWNTGQSHVTLASSVMGAPPPQAQTLGGMRTSASARDLSQLQPADHMAKLRAATTLQEQLDVLHTLVATVGLDHRTELGTVSQLIREIYTKVGRMRLWSLVRHSAGLLQMWEDNIAQSLSYLLLRQKRVSIGLPPREIIIDRPLAPEDISRLIYDTYNEDVSTAVLTMEIMAYLQMMIRIEPVLFEDMSRLRIGLIIRGLCQELSSIALETCTRRMNDAAAHGGASSSLGKDEAGDALFTGSTAVSGLSPGLLSYAADEAVSLELAAERLMSLGPFVVKNLLYRVLSGKEEEETSAGDSKAEEEAAIATLKSFHSSAASNPHRQFMSKRPRSSIVMTPIAPLIHEDNGREVSMLVEEEDGEDDPDIDNADAGGARIEVEGVTQEVGTTTLVTEVSAVNVNPSNLAAPTGAFLRVRNSLSDGEGLLREESSVIVSSRPSRTGQWLRRRRLDGTLNRSPARFYQRVWHVLECCPSGMSTHSHLLPAYPTVQDMTESEIKFAERVDEMLACVLVPEMRQLVVEALSVVSMLLESEPTWSHEGVLNLDEIVRVAVRLFELDINNDVCPDSDTAVARNPLAVASATSFARFFDTAPSGQFGTVTYLGRALRAIECDRLPEYCRSM